MNTHSGYSIYARPVADSDLEFRRAYIRSLSRAQRRVLGEHANGRQEIVADKADRGVRTSLASKRLIRFDRCLPPKYTEATEAGREIIATMLAKEAEELLEYLEP